MVSVVGFLFESEEAKGRKLGELKKIVSGERLQIPSSLPTTVRQFVGF